MIHPSLGALHGSRIAMLAAGACLALSLQACINRDHPDDGSGSTTGGGTTGGATTGGGSTPGACANLSSATMHYKGGDALGEELTLTLDPDTLAYTITIDASLQRSAGTQRSGTLTQIDGCAYTSDESGAVFTLAANGTVEGGVQTPDATRFVPLLGFASTYNNRANPTAFNDIAFIFNAIGVQSNGTTASAYAGAGRLRNAGTLQFCVDPAVGFIVYDTGCANTAKGYISYNADHDAFDLYTTDPTGSAVTTGGTLSGSMVIGQVGTAIVPLQLVRDSATNYGMRVLTPQDTLASGNADGSYSVVDSAGSNADAIWSGADFSRAGTAATLAYDTPVVGVVQVSGALNGYLLYSGGIYVFRPSAGDGAAFELGVMNDGETTGGGTTGGETTGGNTTGGDTTGGETTGGDTTGGETTGGETTGGDTTGGDTAGGDTTGGETTGGETTGGDTPPAACANLPDGITRYKGGDGLGEELTLIVNPSTLSYTVTLDASLQRSAGTHWTGTLTAIEGCAYTSAEAGAVFTLADHGVIEGGVRTPAGTGFVPMLVFASTYNNSADPTAFNDVALIFNAAGSLSNGTTTTAYAGAGRLRNAGTMQFCSDDASGFMLYDSGCANTEKGYIRYNSDHKGFDYFATDPGGSAVTSDGVLSGSMIIGEVGSAAVPLQLVRESASRYGMRILTPQQSLASGAADGSYSVVTSAGGYNDASWAGSAFHRGGASATLAYDMPVAGVVEAGGTLNGHLIEAAGIYGFVPSGGSVFELGVRNGGESIGGSTAGGETTGGDTTGGDTTGGETTGGDTTGGETTGGDTTGGDTTGGDTTGGDTPPTACANLPVMTTNYKGGDALGEELTLTLDPDTLNYTITVDASAQRAAASQRSGTLTQVDGCRYASDESGAVFTVAENGVVEGGMQTPAGTGFTPILAFASTYNNSAAPTTFNDIAFIFNAVGVQTSDSVTASYGGSGRLRNAGTLQFCTEPMSSGFMLYDSGCAQTEKGYISYNPGHDGFDLYTTDPAGSAVSTGGTLSGSMIIGQVGGAIVPLQLLRDSATRYGMRILTPQAALASGTADGSYAVADSVGDNAEASWSGADFSRGGTAATLSYDQPVAGVVEASGALAGHLLYAAGIYGFVPASGTGAAFELGVAP